MTAEHRAVMDFVIPRKGGKKRAESRRPLLENISLNSDEFRTVYWPMFRDRLSNSHRERNISCVRCDLIYNRSLEEKFKAFQKELEEHGEPSDVSVCFMRLMGPPNETQLIAEYGLFTGNSFVGDLGEAPKGVHLNESPDLVTPAPFIEQTRIRIMAFKVLKGRSNCVGLSSFQLGPTHGCASHIAKPPTGVDNLNRHELFRYNQVYVYEETEPDKYAQVPSNVLPCAVFTVDFPPNTNVSFKPQLTTVWNGSLKVGESRYSNLVLQTNGGIHIKPPFFGATFEVTDLVPWRNCLEYPPVIDLLSYQVIGKLGVKKEVALPTVKRLATYFTLKSTHDNPSLAELHESMRLNCVAGLSVLGSLATVLMIPNGEFSSLLALPCREGVIFHCIHLTKTLTESLLTGIFEPLTPEETDEFVRPPCQSELVDGQDPAVKTIIESLASGCVLQKGSNGRASGDSPVDSTQRKKLPRHPDATPENMSPTDMDIVIGSDDEESNAGQPERQSPEPAQLSIADEHPVEDSPNTSVPTPTNSAALEETMRGLNTSLVIANEPSSSGSLGTSNERSVDPRHRSRTGVTALPLPNVCHLSTTTMRTTQSADRLSDTVISENQPQQDHSRKEVEEVEQMEEPTEDVCYSPSQAISEEALSNPPSPPSGVPSRVQSPAMEQPVRTPVQFFALDEDDGYEESPASPPPEVEVYVAPKIIATDNLRETSDQPSMLSTASHEYKAPEVPLFASGMNKFQLSSAGLRKLNEMGVMLSGGQLNPSPSTLPDSPASPTQDRSDTRVDIGNSMSAGDHPSWSGNERGANVPADVDYRTMAPRLPTASASIRASSDVDHRTTNALDHHHRTALFSMVAPNSMVPPNLHQPPPSTTPSLIIEPPRLLESVPPPLALNMSHPPPISRNPVNQPGGPFDLTRSGASPVMMMMPGMVGMARPQSSPMLLGTQGFGQTQHTQGAGGSSIPQLPAIPLPSTSPPPPVAVTTSSVGLGTVFRGLGGIRLGNIRPVSHQPAQVSSQTLGGGGRVPVPLHAVRPRQLVEIIPRPACFTAPPPQSPGEMRPAVRTPILPKRFDINLAQRAPFEPRVTGGFGFFNQPSAPPAQLRTPSPSAASSADSSKQAKAPPGYQPRD